MVIKTKDDDKIAIGFDRDTLEELVSVANSNEKDYDDCACWLFIKLDEDKKGIFRLISSENE